MSFVILITGSRGWSDFGTILEALAYYEGGPTITVRHGDCPDGADMLADRAAKSLGYEIDPMPLDWSLGKGAGLLRNLEMIHKQPKPNICLAFGVLCQKKNCKENEGKPHVTHGTRHCSREAEKAGIVVKRYRG